MADISITDPGLPEIPAAPPDAENEAIKDARKVFLITAVSAVAFVLFGAFITVITRFG